MATVTAIVFAIVGLIFLFRSLCIVPQQSAFVIERLGRYHSTLAAGLWIIIPLIDRVAYKHSLKEIPYDVASQVCITRDNTQVRMDGILYYQVVDARQASYGVSNFEFAIEALAKTTLRSEVGKRELDKLLEDRDAINRIVVAAVDDASSSWGVKVFRYEIKDIEPPKSILQAMQLQITAEREKRAKIAESEGERQKEINLSEGEKQAAIAVSEGHMTAKINNAKGDAESIRLVADATAAAVKMVAEAINAPGGMEAINLKVAEQYVGAFGNIAKAGTTLIVPGNLADMSALVATALNVIKADKVEKAN